MKTRAEEITTVVGLFRVSTEIQEREGYSLAAQQSAFARDCRQFGWRSLGTFEGQESGSSLTQRQTIHALIAFLREKRPDGLWLIEQSRLTRGDELDVALLLRELRESGTKVVLERGSVVDPQDMEGAFVFRLKALMDRREWEVIAARNRRGKDEKAKRGLLASGRPAYGYTVTGADRNRGQRVPVPAEAQIVRSIFEWAAEGFSLRQIIERLYEQGIAAPSQVGRASGQRPKRFKNAIQLWGRTALRRMLSNPIYVGVSYRHCWVKRGKSFAFDRSNPEAIWIEGAHEAIVTPELFSAAQRQMERKRAATHARIHMLTGLLGCPHCGNGFHVTSGRSPGAVDGYYVCKSKRSGSDEFGRRLRTSAACPSRWLRRDVTDRRIWDAFVRLVTSPEMIERYLASGPATARRAALHSELEQFRRTQSGLEAKLARAREKLLSEVLTDGEYLAERERLSAELAGILTRISERNHALEGLSGDVTRRVMQNLAVLKLADRKLTLEQRVRLFRALVRRVRFTDKDMREIEIELWVAPRDRPELRANPLERSAPDTSTAVIVRAPLTPPLA